VDVVKKSQTERVHHIEQQLVAHNGQIKRLVSDAESEKDTRRRVADRIDKAFAEVNKQIGNLKWW
jgi:hypothetical protein